MPITFTLIVESTLVLGILGLAIKEIYLFRSNRKTDKKNGSDTEWMKCKLRDINSASIQTNQDVAVIKTNLTNFSDRCSDHLKVQSEINNSCNSKLKCLDERIFGLVTKDKS